MPRLSNEIDSSPDRAERIISPSGEFNVATSHKLEELLSAACASEGHVVVDLSAVSFIDSSAVSVLLKCRRRFGDGRFSIVAPEGSGPHRVLTITGLDHVIPMRSTV